MALSGFSEDTVTPFPKELPRISGAEAVIRSLIAEGVDTMFGYPGGAIISVYDALYDYRDKIDHILVRHEQCAVHAAQGYARATGRTGVCMVTSGPGATNTVTGLADAMLDSTPIVLISGQVTSSILGTDAFQEINFIEITNSVSKWNCQVKRAEDIPEAIARAFYIASSGRPGPVVVDITKDAQTGMLDFDYNSTKFIRSYMPENDIEETSIIEAARLINLSRKPMALIGQGVILGRAEKELLEFINKSGIPATSTLMGLSALPSEHPQYVGMMGMHGNYAPNIKNRDCDLLIAIGMRFDERATGKPENFGINAKIIHMEIDPAEVNKLVYADVAVMGDVKKTLPLLTEKIAKGDHSAWI
ncbi:MAG: acetolactate synthase large subunit, partial [Bacteroidaceae bacterium]|nr:acetolactate synthase large subunit [Bacteroidaceae bacterium]